MEKTVEIPESMEELTLEQFIDYLELTVESKEGPTRKAIKLMSIMSGIPVEDVELMDAKDFGRLYKELEWLKDVKFESPAKPKDKKDIVIAVEGEEFLFQPDYYWSKIGDMAVVEELLAGRNMFTHFHYVLAIACRKKDEKLDRERIEERAKLFLKCKMKDVYDAMFFFALAGKTSSIFTLAFSGVNEKIQKTIAMMLSLTLSPKVVDSLKNGTGIRS